MARTGLIKKLALNYIHRTAIRNSNPQDAPYILNENESRLIQTVRLQTVLGSAILGCLGVLCLYLPQYYLPHLFPSTPLSLFGKIYSIPIISIVYGVLLIWPEIWGLNYLNLRAARKISKVCEFPRQGFGNFDQEVESLADAGLEVDAKGLNLYEIDPYLGLNKLEYWIYILYSRLKATLTNIVVKLLVKRFLARYVLKNYVDLAGIPVFAFWNAWASWWVVHEIKVRIMAPMALADFVSKIKAECTDAKGLGNILPGVLQHAAQLKRKYNFAQYLLAKSLNEEFPFGDIRHWEVQSMDHVSKQLQNTVSKILLCSMVIDCDLSRRERRELKLLAETDWFKYGFEEALFIAKSYNRGQGLLIK
jgi:hypothetical protein